MPLDLYWRTTTGTEFVLGFESGSMLPLTVLLMIWLTTARHEGSHALAALIQGVPVHEVRLLPGIHRELGFYFGYVSRGDGGTWLLDAAPFFSAMAWFIVFYFLLQRISPGSRLWLPLFFIGLVSPAVDLIYNYQGGLWREGTDVSDLFAVLPDSAVHGSFVAAIGLCLIGISRTRTAAKRNG